jgi:hypothetical protein
VEENDPALTELVVLPMKVFGPLDADRLSRAIGENRLTDLRKQRRKSLFHHHTLDHVSDYLRSIAMVEC